MPDQNTLQTFITVKKADGTSERIPLADFQKKYGGLNAPAKSVGEPIGSTPVAKPAMAVPTPPVSPTTPVSPANVSAPMVSDEHQLSTTAPVTDAFVDQAMAEAHDQPAPTAPTKPLESQIPARRYIDNSKKLEEQKAKWNAVDHRSLLEEELNSEGAQHQTQNHSVEMAELMNVITGLDFSLPSGLLPRLQSLVASAKKGIRTDNQLLEYFQREAGMGGLGLDSVQAGALLKLLQTKYNLPTENRKFGQMIAKKTAEGDVLSASVSTLSPAPSQTAYTTQSNPPARPSTVPFEAKPMVRDVVAPQPVDRPAIRPETVSPIDELKNFNLTDWRRLSNDPAEVENKILQKFEIIKKDSYLQFLQARSAWRQSPIFRAYQAILAESLSTNQPINSLATGIDGAFTAPEVVAMVRISERI